MSDIIAGDPAPTNPVTAIRTDMNARERVQVMIRTDRHSETVWSDSEASDALDAYRAEVLVEVADLLMQADETAAALLVDRMRDGGESR